MISNVDQIRLAVALSALKFKPPELSFSSYVLDLCSKFPLSTSPTSDSLWRTHALSIERDYAKLLEKYEAEKIKSLTLVSSGSDTAAPSSTLEQSSSSISKKKTKKKLATALGSEIRLEMSSKRVDLKSVLEGLHHGTDILKIPGTLGPNSILSLLSDVLQLVSLPNAQPALLLSVTVRTIEAIAKVLGPILSTPNDIAAIDTLETLSVVLHHMFAAVIPWLASSPDISSVSSSTSEPTTPSDLEEPIYILLERFTALIFIPMIRAFIKLSQSYLDSIFFPHTAGTSTSATSFNPAGNRRPPGHTTGPTPPLVSLDPVDVRANVLSLFQVIFCFLNSQLQQQAEAIPSLRMSLHTLRASLILETVRELEHMLSPMVVSGSLSVPDDTADTPIEPKSHLDAKNRICGRVKRLAIKDAWWYLCNILHILLGEPPGLVSFMSSSVMVSVMPGKNQGGNIKDASVAEKQNHVYGGGERLLNQGISDSLFRLVTRCKRARHHQTQTYDNSEQSKISPEKDILGNYLCPQGRSNDGRTNTRMDGETNEKDRWNIVQAVGDSGVDFDVGVSAGGRPKASSHIQDATVPQVSPAIAEGFEEFSQKMIDLEEVEYGMLLSAVEHYWVWSQF